jgi:hypothetical protein
MGVDPAVWKQQRGIDDWMRRTSGGIAKAALWGVFTAIAGCGLFMLAIWLSNQFMQSSQ